MTERWVGIVVAGDSVILVDSEVPETGQLVLQNDATWRLQAGDRAPAYNVIHQQCRDYLAENKISKVLIMESATARGAGLLHLRSAELRGVVYAAAASVCEVKSVSKSVLSRTFGERKVGEYEKDDGFWTKHFTGTDLRVGSRSAAIMLLSESGRNA